MSVRRIIVFLLGGVGVRPSPGASPLALAEMTALDHTGNRIAAGRRHRRKIGVFVLCESSPPLMRFCYRPPLPADEPANLGGVLQAAPHRARGIP
jgi:hypothetical protein